MRWQSVLLLPTLVASVACSNVSNAPPAGTAGSAAPAATTPTIAGKAARGAIITLEPTSPREFPLPDGPAIMDQYAKQFVPDMLLVRVGQPVEFRNSEDSPHNVNVHRMPTGTEIFNVATAPYQKHVHTFAEPGLYSVACDIHPGMIATVVATITPYVAVASDAGAFQFSDLSPGDYNLRWTAGGRNGEKTVSVTAGTTTVSIP